MVLVDKTGGHARFPLWMGFCVSVCVVFLLGGGGGWGVWVGGGRGQGVWGCVGGGYDFWETTKIPHKNELIH